MRKLAGNRHQRFPDLEAGGRPKSDHRLGLGLFEEMEDMSGLQHPVYGKRDACRHRTEDRPIDRRYGRKQNCDDIAAPNSADPEESAGLVDISA
jgi:hypothetical protein